MSWSLKSSNNDEKIKGIGGNDVTPAYRLFSALMWAGTWEAKGELRGLSTGEPASNNSESVIRRRGGEFGHDISISRMASAAEEGMVETKNGKALTALSPRPFLSPVPLQRSARLGSERAKS